MAIAGKHIEWIEARGISVELAEKLGLDTVREAGAAWLSVPYIKAGKVINHKYRLISEKRHRMDAGAPLGLFNHDCLLENPDQPLVITEGEWDAITAIQLGWRAVSVPNGAPAKASEDPSNAKRYEYLWEAGKPLLDVKRFILATDSDEAGIALRADLIHLLGPARCSFVEYPDGCKDLNDVLIAHGAERVASCLNQAKPVPVRGLHRLSDFPAMPEIQKIDLLDIPAFDELWGVVPGTVTVISGYPGHGKSSLVIKLIANAMGARSIPTALGSFETMPAILERRILAAMDERAEHDPTIWKNEQARRIMAERLMVIANTPDEDHELDLETMVDLAEVAVMRHGTKLLVIDPWNEVEHKRQRDETETDYVSRAIRLIKRFAQRTATAVWIVAHPRKPSSDGVPKHPPCLYDLAGSANWNNKADYGIIVHRPNLEASEIVVQNVKARMGLPGRIGRVTLEFDAARSRYRQLGM